MKFFIAAGLLLSSLNLFAYTKDKVYKLTILHTNDHHGRFWANNDGEYGLAARATLIQQIRNEVQRNGGHVLLLDAGDVNTGVPQSDMQNAEPDFRGMAMLGYDVMAVGNHEFDKSLPTILKQREWAGFPFISANIYSKSTKKRIFPAAIYKMLGDLKVSIFGLTTEDTPATSNIKNSQGLYFVPAVEEAKKVVPFLRPQTDVLIGLTHMGHYENESHGPNAPGDVTLARQVPGIDLIVGGHTQKPLFKPDIQNGTIIVQAQEWGKFVGRVDLEFINGKVLLKRSQLIPVNLKDSNFKIAPDAYVESVLRPFKEKGDSSLLIHLGVAHTEFIGRREILRSQETNLGNMVTFAYKEKFKTDMAITNSGGLRDSIYKGKVTYESVLMVLPFGEQIGISQLSGNDLKKYLEYVIFTFTPGNGNFPHISGVEILADAASKKIVSLHINGAPVVPSRIYSIALPEFIAAGGDKYPPLKFKKTNIVAADIIKDFILAKKELRPQEFAPRGYIQIK